MVVAVHGEVACSAGALKNSLPQGDCSGYAIELAVAACGLGKSGDVVAALSRAVAPNGMVGSAVAVPWLSELPVGALLCAGGAAL